MNSFNKPVGLTTLCFLLSQLWGCASSSLIEKWHDPSFQAPPLQKMLVIAGRKDPTKRRIWEDAFTGDFNKHGMTAISSYSLFPDMPPDTDQVIAAVKTSGFDGILAILILPTETTKEFYPGYTTYEQSVPTIPYYGTYWKRYRTYYREIEHPGYTDSQSVDFRAIDISTTGTDGKLIWSATSRTPDPGTVSDVQQDIVNLVRTDLVKRKIINSGK